MKLNLGILTAALAGTLVAPTVPALERVDQTNVYHAVKMRPFTAQRDLAREKYSRDWDFKNGTSNNFTWLPPAVAPTAKVADGALSFSAGTNSITLGWGNFENRQPLDQRVFLWPDWNWIELKVKQTADKSDWTVALSQDGKASAPWRPRDQTSVSQTLTGTAWQILGFWVQIPNADGFALTIKGPADNQVAIASIRILQKELYGCYRREVDLPRDNIWRAIAEVSCHSRLYVNGREIPLQRAYSVFFVTTSVDLAPFLKKGKNCIALLDRLPLTPRLDTQTPRLAYLQGAVVMAGGAVIRLDTPAGWKAAEKEADGWTRPGFDDSAWAPAVAEPHYSNERDEFHRKMPAYEGRLVLENPGSDPKLFFNAADPLKVNVRVPDGLAPQKPALKWILRRAADEPVTNAVEPEVATGTVGDFTKVRKTDSLVFEVDAGRQPRGVYTLEVGLWAGAQCLEKRIREPLAVVGKIPMPEVRGTNYTDGLKLVLEDTLDFTDPADPHPWVESKKQEGAGIEGVSQAKIVRQDGLVYRESSDGAGAGVTAHFSYQFAFQRPSGFYLMELDYPDNADRCIGVSVEALDVWGSRDPKIVRSNKSGPAVITGYKYPVTGQLCQLRWLHCPDSRDQVVDIASLAKGRCAAATRLRIYRVEGELPAPAVKASGERLLGIHTERARTVAGLYGLQDPGPYQLVYLNKLHLDMIQHATQRLKWMLEGCENYARYLRFSGQNVHVMGAFQYDEHNLSYFQPDLVPTARIPVLDIREMALRVLAANDIAMLSMVEYCIHRKLSDAYSVSDGQVALGAETVFPVSKDGQQAGGAGCVSQGCFDHPAVQQAYFNVIDDLALKFSFSPAWKGVYLMAFPTFSGPVTYAPKDAPFDYDYSDATIAAFERETRIRVPVDPKDPKRFEKRYAFLTSAGLKAQWINWRCQTVRQQVLQTRDLLQRHRKDLQVMYGYYFGAEHVLAWVKSGRPYLEFLRDYGWDPTLFAKDRDIWCGRYFYPNRSGDMYGTYGHAVCTAQEVGREPLAAFERDLNRLAVFNTCWHEVDLFAPGSSHVWDGQESHVTVATNWPAPEVHVRYVSQPNNANALECFTEAMIGSDPEAILFGFTDAMMPMGYEQELREFSRAFLPLPKAKFQPVLGTADFCHNLAIRDLRQDQAYWFYVANPGYWPIKGQVVLNGTASLVDPATDDPVATREEAGRTIVPVDLPGYGIVAFKSKIENPAQSGTSRKLAPQQAGAAIQIISWTNAPVAAEHLMHQRQLLAEAERMLGIPEVAGILTMEERAFMNDSVARAKADLQAGEIARAWAALTDARFWLLLKDHLQPAARFTARIPGYTPQTRRPDDVPALNAVRAAQPPKIDGQLDEAVWKEAPRTEGFVSAGTQGEFRGLPVIATLAQAAYDDRCLYLGFTMADKAVGALKQTAQRPEEVLNSYNDAMVVFLHPDDIRVFQLAVNPAGLKYNADATGQAGHFRRHDADFGPWEAAVGKTESVWTLEIAIPYTTVKVAAPHAGGQWRVNFLRRYRDFLVPEMYWAMIKKSWYDTDQYGYLKFM